MATSQEPPASRRPPPPCWSDDETAALITAYRHKWYSLRRANLRAPDWQHVADAVAAAARFPLANPPKTSIQCRHKMEKLRRRYRTEVQRMRTTAKPPSWVHFRLMDSMELGLGFGCSGPLTVPNNREDEDESEEDMMVHTKGIKQSIALSVNRRYRGSVGNRYGNGNRVRIRIPNGDGLFDDLPPSMNPGYGSGRSSRNGYSEGRKRDGNVMSEMVAAIERLGDGFVRMERMKMDVVREVESMRMKRERRRTEMILETQRKMWDLFADVVLERSDKKMKRMVTPEL